MPSALLCWNWVGVWAHAPKGRTPRSAIQRLQVIENAAQIMGSGTYGDKSSNPAARDVMSSISQIRTRLQPPRLRVEVPSAPCNHNNRDQFREIGFVPSKCSEPRAPQVGHLDLVGHYGQPGAFFRLTHSGFSLRLSGGMRFIVFHNVKHQSPG
jgi:hypothetical protein